MKKKSLHDVHKATKANILEWIPFQIVSDGEVIATVVDVYDVHKADKPKSNDVVRQYGAFSKQAQAAGRMRSK